MSRLKITNVEHEVREIYDLLSRHEEHVSVPLFEKPSLNHPQSKRIINRFVLIPFLAFVSFTVFNFAKGWPVEYIKLAFFVFLIVVYVALPTVQILEIYQDSREFMKFFKNSNEVVLEGLVETIADDCHLACSLEGFSAEALQLVKDRIEAQRIAIDARLGAMVGALPKIGIVPGLITVFIAASSQLNEIVTILIAIVAFVAYILVFAIHFSLPRFGYYVNLLDSEIQRKSQ